MMELKNEVKYFYDNDGKLVYPSEIKDGEEYKSTVIPPISIINGVEIIMNEPKFDGEKWVDQSKLKIEPNQEQQILSTLAKQVMNLQLENVQQKQINANLTKEIMNLKGDGTHE